MLLPVQVEKTIRSTLGLEPRIYRLEVCRLFQLGNVCKFFLWGTGKEPGAGVAPANIS